MRDWKTLGLGLAIALALSGCTVTERRWGTCAIAGALIGGTVGGVTGGVAVNNNGNASNGERAAGIVGGGAAGVVIGGLLGHAICDPMIEAPPPPPVAQAPPPPPPASKKIETLTGPSFDFDKVHLRPEGVAKVEHAVRVMGENPSMHVVVDGYTDSIGSDAYNLKLSERRAEAVRDLMVQKGISASRITTHGYGKSRPVASNNTAEGRAENRRVEIVAE